MNPYPVFLYLHIGSLRVKSIGDPHTQIWTQIGSYIVPVETINSEFWFFVQLQSKS